MPTSEPETERWVLVGMLLARQQPEFTQPRRKRGRPKGPTGLPKDTEILDAIEQVAAQRGVDFDTVLSHAVPVLIAEGVLVQADRTTHPKRLRRLRQARRAKVRDGLVRALMGDRDK
jgi:hypothetical protein